MGSLRIFPKDPNSESSPRTSFADDVVGRFRSGYQIDGTPASLSEWRVTTGDPAVADTIHDILGGDAPQEWAAKGEDNLEVFTASDSIEIIIENEKSLRQRLILWGRNNQPIYTTDGETKDDGTPDPDRELSLADRKAKAKAGTGPQPDVELFFRLAAEPELGLFKFQSGSWSLVSDLDHNDTEARIAAVGGPCRATLKLEEVSFVAKNGARKGQTITYTKPVIKILGAVK